MNSGPRPRRTATPSGFVRPPTQHSDLTMIPCRDYRSGPIFFSSTFRDAVVRTQAWPHGQPTLIGRNGDDPSGSLISIQRFLFGLRTVGESRSVETCKLLVSLDNLFHLSLSTVPNGKRNVTQAQPNHAKSDRPPRLLWPDHQDNKGRWPPQTHGFAPRSKAIRGPSSLGSSQNHPERPSPQQARGNRHNRAIGVLCRGRSERAREGRLGQEGKVFLKVSR